MESFFSLTTFRFFVPGKHNTSVPASLGIGLKKDARLGSWSFAQAFLALQDEVVRLHLPVTCGKGVFF